MHTSNYIYFYYMPEEKSMTWMNYVINALITFTVVWVLFIILGIKTTHNKMLTTQTNITNTQLLLKQELYNIQSNQSIILSNQANLVPRYMTQYNYVIPKNTNTTLTP